MHGNRGKEMRGDTGTPRGFIDQWTSLHGDIQGRILAFDALEIFNLVLFHKIFYKIYFNIFYLINFYI